MSVRAQRAERVLSYLREKSEYSRPGPAPSRSLKPYISGTSCLIDKRSSLIIPLGCKSCMAWLPYCVSADHGTWRVPNLGYFGRPPKTLYLNNCTTAGPIGLRFCIQLGTQQTIHVCGSFFWGVLQHVRTCTPRFHISRTTEPIALICGM